MPLPESVAAGPRLLFVALNDWVSAERLPGELHRHGCQVAVLCPRDFFLAQTRHVDHVFPLPAEHRGLWILPWLEYSVRAWRPMRIVPVDEHVVRFLHNIAHHHKLGALASPHLRQLVRDSLGDPHHYAAIATRIDFATLVQQLGVRAPRAIAITSPHDAQPLIARSGFPLVLKSEGTVGGSGVRIVHNAQDLAAALAHTTDTTAPILAQEFIVGTPTMYALAAERGTVIAGLAFVKECVNPTPTGPSTVVRYVPHPEMEATARAIVAATRLSGFVSIDFIVDSAQRAHVIEINPRASMVCHLGRHVGTDLCAAYTALLSGRPHTDVAGPVRHPRIALFPRELARDPASPYLQHAYHDVPEDDPALVAAYRAWLARPLCPVAKGSDIST